MRELWPAPSLQPAFLLLLVLSAACSGSSDDLDRSVLAFETEGSIRLVDIQPNGTKVLLEVLDDVPRRLIEVDLETRNSRIVEESDDLDAYSGVFTETGLLFYDGGSIVIDNDEGRVRFERPDGHRIIAARGDRLVLANDQAPGFFRYRPEDGLTNLLPQGRVRPWHPLHELLWISQVGTGLDVPLQAWVYDAATDRVIDAPVFDDGQRSGRGSYFAGTDADGWFLWRPDGRTALPSEPNPASNPMVNPNPQAVCGLTATTVWGARVGAASTVYEFDRATLPPAVEASDLGTSCFYTSSEGQPVFRLDVEDGTVDRLSGPAVTVAVRPTFRRRVPVRLEDKGLWVDSKLYLPWGEWTVSFDTPPPSAVEPDLADEPRVALDPDSGTGVWYEPINRVAYRIDLPRGMASSVPLEGADIWLFPSPDGRFVFQCSAEEPFGGYRVALDRCVPGSVPQVLDTVNGTRRPIADAPVGVRASMSGWISNNYAVWVDISPEGADDPTGRTTSRLWALRLR